MNAAPSMPKHDGVVQGGAIVFVSGTRLRVETGPSQIKLSRPVVSSFDGVAS